MTKWQEFPIRPQGRPWSGINTRSGKLDDGSGQMKDSSVNVIINKGDQLEKRKGLVRGIDERFAGAVCGLHTYTDECGREWLLVADQAGFSIRQPFAVPNFANSDAYPSDSFQSNGAVNPLRWLNSILYEQLAGSLVLKSSVLDGGDMLWFKDASNFSYQTTADYDLSETATCRAVVVIKASAGQARIEGRVIASASNVTFELVWIDSLGAETCLGIAGVGPFFTGCIRLSYQRDVITGTFTAKAIVDPPTAAAITLEDSTTLTALNDADFGQRTALRLERDLAATSVGILEVNGGPI